MVYTFNIEKYELEFIKPAKTSRNTFKSRTVYFIHLKELDSGKSGLGEAAPLSLLSIDDVADYEQILDSKLEEFCSIGSLQDMDLSDYPSIRFGIETTLLDLEADKDGRLYSSPFTLGERAIPVNGLVWMDNAETMYDEALKKIALGFSVIKFKVGALDFDDECRMLERIRKEFTASKITLRLDANGGFKPDEAAEQLKELKRFEIHSIEQPVKPKLWDDMARLCKESQIDIALDEELIGLDVDQEGLKLLKYIKPKYLILKPNLIGGLSIADRWISFAHKNETEWWATSALESNVGLNAIAQWVSQYSNTLHQGLGTGALFTNNTNSKLHIQNGKMSFVV